MISRRVGCSSPIPKIKINKPENVCSCELELFFYSTGERSDRSTFSLLFSPFGLGLSFGTKQWNGFPKSSARVRLLQGNGICAYRLYMLDPSKVEK